jgi:protein-tyrosine phosphatase
MFEESNSYIDDIKAKNGIVFVHCLMGKSRSATLVIAYLMKTLKMKFLEAYEHVKKARKIIFPNFGFLKQLREYEKALFPEA